MQPNWLPNLCNNQYFFNYSYLLPKCLWSLADSWAVCWATGQTQWTLFITLTAKLSQLHFIIAAVENWKLKTGSQTQEETQDDPECKCDNEKITNDICSYIIRIFVLKTLWRKQKTQLQSHTHLVACIAQKTHPLPQRLIVSVEYNCVTDCRMGFHLILVHYKNIPWEIWNLQQMADPSQAYFYHSALISVLIQLKCWSVNHSERSTAGAPTYWHKDDQMIL